ncbi:MAG TPA: hypothetical protein VJJ51_09895 [Candidatus Methanoperedens sp.]|nr:hypothetical protein [Candidatus Methanoperedens sp.]HLB71341.1 hypothetical protein [Candidatus Methanoperedens sp.]
MLKKLTLVFLLLTVVALIGVPWASAYPVFRDTFFKKYTNAYPDLQKDLKDNPSSLKTCLICHLPGNPPLGYNTAKRNPFGVDFGKTIKKDEEGEASTTEENITKALTDIEQNDSDGDGSSNIGEINSNTFPGDKDSKPEKPIPPIPELSTVILSSAGLFALILVSRKYR